MKSTTIKTKISEIYKEAGLLYIRYNAEIETKSNGQKKIAGKRPAFSKIEKQKEYNKGDGRYYSLLMGREGKPGQYAVLLDFDNKCDENHKSGLELMAKLKMDKYNAPKQSTPSGGFHYIFWVDEKQKEFIGSPTGMMYKGEKYNMDVKFKNGLANCFPSKIDGYGEYRWENPTQLRDIPQLPKVLFDLISRKTPVPKSLPIPKDTIDEPWGKISENIWKTSRH